MYMIGVLVGVGLAERASIVVIWLASPATVTVCPLTGYIFGSGTSLSAEMPVAFTKADIGGPSA